MLITMSIESNSQIRTTASLEEEKLTAIRKELNSCPEYSHLERETAKILIKYLQETSPDKIYSGIGGNGIIAEYSGKAPGPSKMFRCEMDAIKTDKGFEHLCGHDGHMAIMLGLAKRLSAGRDFPGKVYLLFQPAEEIGEGAALMVKDIEKLGLVFDYSYALHNNPKYPLNSIIIHKGTYAAGSVGMELKFTGASSHAAFPEQAISPSDAIFSVMQEVKRINKEKNGFTDFVLATVVNVEIGEANYGVTPGDGAIRLTLRSFVDGDLGKLCSEIEKFAQKKAGENGLKLAISYHDRFPATVNSNLANTNVIEAAEKAGLKILYAKEPTRGSDDFSFFTIKSNGSFFDIGNGEGGADIHQPDYKFPDEILIPAVNLFSEIIYKH
ncbi:MAG: yhaA [Bacteroidetes bacterium]|nr:yhaA [Bacteroidota bacterium]